MDEERREDLDDRDHTYLEDDFFHQITVLENGVGGVAQALGKKEPGNDAGNQPEDKGIIFHRGRPEADIEDKPEQQNRDRRLYESPEEVQIGAQIPGLDIATGQVEDEGSAPEECNDKAQKENAQIFDSVHAFPFMISAEIPAMHSARASCQGRTGIPNTALIFSLERQELAGRKALVGYCSVLMGRSRTSRSRR